MKECEDIRGADKNRYIRKQTRPWPTINKDKHSMHNILLNIIQN